MQPTGYSKPVQNDPSPALSTSSQAAFPYSGTIVAAKEPSFILSTAPASHLLVGFYLSIPYR